MRPMANRRIPGTLPILGELLKQDGLGMAGAWHGLRDQLSVPCEGSPHSCRDGYRKLWSQQAISPALRGVVPW